MRSARRAIVAVLLVAYLASASALAAGHSGTNVSQSPDDSLSPVVACNGRFVHVAWIESMPLTDGLRATIFAARSVDGGQSFEAPRVVAPLIGFATSLRIRVTGERVDLTWLVSTFTTGSPAAVDYAVSRDDGATFEPARAVNADASPGSPELVASGEFVALAWAARGKVWLAGSVDAGATFGAPVEISRETPAVDGSCRISLANVTVEAVWLEQLAERRQAVFRAVSLSSPASSPQAQVVSPPSGDAGEPAIAAEGSTIIALWTDAQDGRRLAGARSNDGGDVFVPITPLGRASQFARPKVVIVDSIVHVSWVGRGSKLRYVRIGPGASSPKITAGVTETLLTDLSVRGSIVCLAWQTGSGRDVRTRVAVSRDGGATFARSLVLGSRSAPASAPSAATDGTSACVVWQGAVSREADVFFWVSDSAE